MAIGLSNKQIKMDAQSNPIVVVILNDFESKQTYAINDCLLSWKNSIVFLLFYEQKQNEYHNTTWQTILIPRFVHWTLAAHTKMMMLYNELVLSLNIDTWNI